MTVPSFVTAVWLLLLFAVQLHLLPTGGWGQWYHYIMPVIALGPGTHGAHRPLHAHQHPGGGRADFIRTARAKGLSEQPGSAAAAPEERARSR